jgi:hypothetical protein
MDLRCPERLDDPAPIEQEEDSSPPATRAAHSCLLFFDDWKAVHGSRRLENRLQEHRRRWLIESTDGLDHAYAERLLAEGADAPPLVEPAGLSQLRDCDATHRTALESSTVWQVEINKNVASRFPWMDPIRRLRPGKQRKRRAPRHRENDPDEDGASSQPRPPSPMTLPGDGSEQQFIEQMVEWLAGWETRHPTPAVTREPTPAPLIQPRLFLFLEDLAEPMTRTPETGEDVWKQLASQALAAFLHPELVPKRLVLATLGVAPRDVFLWLAQGLYWHRTADPDPAQRTQSHWVFPSLDTRREYGAMRLHITDSQGSDDRYIRFVRFDSLGMSNIVFNEQGDVRFLSSFASLDIMPIEDEPRAAALFANALNPRPDFVQRPLVFVDGSPPSPSPSSPLSSSSRLSSLVSSRESIPCIVD